ncbi:MAG: restriction endonuclease [Myxococcales bacterium]|nr:restriction endonuclease [Myxococcales bacterium]
MSRDNDDESGKHANGGLGRLVSHYRLRAEAGALSVTAGEVRLAQGHAQASPMQAHGRGFVLPVGAATERDEAHALAPAVVHRELLLQSAVVRLGERVPEGQVVEAVMVPWTDLVRAVAHDPEFLRKVDPRTMEELVAGAYRADGYEVVLTPRSGDLGRDVIATRGDLKICVLDQVKRYTTGHRVTGDEVNAMLGVITKFPNTSKGFVTTTASFAPGVLKDPHLQQYMPYRLELRDGDALLEWFSALASTRNPQT